MSYIQLPYGYVEKEKQVQFNLPNSYEESFYSTLNQQSPQGIRTFFILFLINIHPEV